MGPAMRCKVKCVSITQSEYGHSLKFQPVSGSNAENAAFFKATPSGVIELSTINEKIIPEFEPGATYYVDFTRAFDA